MIFVNWYKCGYSMLSFYNLTVVLDFELFFLILFFLDASDIRSDSVKTVISTLTMWKSKVARQIQGMQILLIKKYDIDLCNYDTICYSMWYFI